MDILSSVQQLSKQLHQTPLSILCIASASLGIFSHLLYFIRGIPDAHVSRIVAVYVTAGTALFLLSLYGSGLLGLPRAAILWCVYFIGLVFSSSIYRLFLHPLCHVPGPFGAKITRLYFTWLASRRNRYRDVVPLFNKYGKWVRLGPDSVHSSSAEAFVRMHSAGSGFSKKGTVYQALVVRGERNLDTIVDHGEHRARRKVWDKAMNTKAVEKYELYAHEAVSEWIKKLAEFDGKPVDTTVYSELIAFENMGRMGFSKEFGVIRSGKRGRMQDLLRTMFSTSSALGELWWPIVLLNDLGITPAPAEEFFDLAIKLTEERMARGDIPEDEQPDIVTHFIQDAQSEKPQAMLNENILHNDAEAIMVGGAESIGGALGFSFYFLAGNKAAQAQLLAEISPLFGRTVPGEFVDSDLRYVSYLNAIINEVLRIWPPVPTLNRSVPPGGVEVDGLYIPEGCTLCVNLFAMHRNPEYFVRPDDFIPERWTTRPELVLNQKAFAPFIMGPYSCPGSRIALQVIRHTLAYTVWNYDFEFAPGEDGTDIIEKLTSDGAYQPGPLRCVFHKRV